MKKKFKFVVFIELEGNESKDRARAILGTALESQKESGDDSRFVGYSYRNPRKSLAQRSFPESGWRSEVANGTIRRSYKGWVKSKLEERHG